MEWLLKHGFIRKKKHFSIKTQKYFKGTVISQGLLMGLEDFPNLFDKDLGGDVYKKSGKPVAAGDFLTEKLVDFIPFAFTLIRK